MTLKAIETSYNGYRFRSRLEARWAVFFDELGIRYDYEPQGFEVRGGYGKTWPYLPDFHLSDLNTWVEVKGSVSLVDDDYLEMIANAIDWGGCLPGVGNSLGTTRGLLWLGNIPQVKFASTPAHIIFQHSKGGWMEHCRFIDSPPYLVSSGDGSNYFDTSCGGSCAKVFRPFLTKCENLVASWNVACCQKVANSYQRARMARFEHGETPTVK